MENSIINNIFGIDSFDLIPMDPYNKVINNLYIGGAINDTSKFKYVYCTTNDIIIRGKSNQINILMTFEDNNLLPNTELLYDLVDMILDSMKKGPTYVHCSAGLNRSAMIVVLVLIKTGFFTATSAIEHLRKVRSETVLHNKTFHDWLLTQ